MCICFKVLQYINLLKHIAKILYHHISNFLTIIWASPFSLASLAAMPTPTICHWKSVHLWNLTCWQRRSLELCHWDNSYQALESDSWSPLPQLLEGWTRGSLLDGGEAGRCSWCCLDLTGGWYQRVRTLCLCWRHTIGLSLTRKVSEASWACFPITAALAYLSHRLADNQ